MTATTRVREVPLVVHGFLPSGAADRLRAPLDDRFAAGTVRHRHVVALVTSTDDDEVLPTREQLLRHIRVLEEAAQGTTVVPTRFGVVVPDADTLVATYLRPHHDTLVERIRRLDGQVELRLRGRFDEEETLRRILASDRRAARLRGRPGLSSRIELGERVAAAIERLRERDARRGVAALRPHVTDLAAVRVSGPLDAFALSLLVDGRELDDLDGAIDGLGEELAPSVELELVGPMPAFSFTTDGAR